MFEEQGISPVGISGFVSVKRDRDCFDFPDHTLLEVTKFDPETGKYHVVVDGNDSTWMTITEIDETFDWRK